MLKDRYGNNINMLYYDTDGITFEVFTKNIYDDLKTEFSEHVDFSKMPKDNEYYNTDNQFVPGKMKIEDGGKIISEFVTTQPKQKASLSLNLESGTFESALKSSGVNQVALNATVGFDRIRDCLLSTSEEAEKEGTVPQEIQKVNSKRIGKNNKNDRFEVSTIPVSRNAYGLDNVKRYGLEDAIHSHSYGHFMDRDL